MKTITLPGGVRAFVYMRAACKPAGMARVFLCGHLICDPFWGSFGDGISFSERAGVPIHLDGLSFSFVEYWTTHYTFTTMHTATHIHAHSTHSVVCLCVCVLPRTYFTDTYSSIAPLCISYLLCKASEISIMAGLFANEYAQFLQQRQRKASLPFFADRLLCRVLGGNQCLPISDWRREDSSWHLLSNMPPVYIS